MTKQNYQEPQCIIAVFEKVDVLTLSENAGAMFNAQDYGWWNPNDLNGGFEQ